MTVIGTGGWADVLSEHAAREESARRLIAQLRAPSRLLHATHFHEAAGTGARSSVRSSIGTQSTAAISESAIDASQTTV